MDADDVRIVEEVARLNTWATAARAVVDPERAREAKRLLHPEVELRSRVMSVEGRVYVGHDGLDRYWEDMLDAFEDWGWAHFRCEALGDGVVLVSGEFHARGRESGAPLRFPVAGLWSVEGGLLRRIDNFASEEEARRAAGL